MKIFQIFRKKYPFKLLLATDAFKLLDVILISKGFEYVVLGKKPQGKATMYYVIERKKFTRLKFWWLQFLLFIKYY